MDRATFDAEVNEMKMTERQEASLIASTLMSVVRDQAISGLYGYMCEQDGAFSVPIERVYTDAFSNHLQDRFFQFWLGTSQGHDAVHWGRGFN